MADSPRISDPLATRRHQAFADALERIRQVEKSRRRALSLSDFYYLADLPSELSQLTWLETLRLPYAHLSDISPLETLHKLETLEVPSYLGKSLHSLRNLEKLAHLQLGSSSLEDLSALEGLHNLRSLSIGCSSSANLISLSQLNNLVQLNLDGGDGNLRPLGDLSNLHTLALRSTNIKSLESVATLKQLKALTIGGNDIRDLSLIARIPGLTFLDLLIVPESADLSWIGTMRQLRTLRLASYWPQEIAQLSELSQLEKLTLDLPMKNLEPVAALTNLMNLDISKTGVRDLTPLAPMVGLVVGAELDRISGGLAYSGKEISDTAIREIGNVGRLQRTRRVLDRIRRITGLPPLDDALKNWTRSARSLQTSWQHVLTSTQPSPIGIRFVQRNEQLAIDPSGDASDEEAAQHPLTQQLHEGVQRRSQDFVPLAIRVNNQPAWQGIGDTAKRFAEAVSAPTIEIPKNIGRVYDAIVELGSYLELDQKLHASADANGHPLEPEIQRALSDLIRSAAPWVRRFPTAQIIDNESGAFLSRPDLYNPSTAAADFAEDAQLISPEDADSLRQLAEAAKRGEFQGQKANNRVVASAKNLALVASALVSLYVGAISSDFATKSTLVMRAGTFLAAGEQSLLQLFSDAPADIQYALRAMMDDLRKQDKGPFLPGQEYLMSNSTAARRSEEDEDENNR